MNQLCPLSDLAPEWCSHCRSDLLDRAYQLAANDTIVLAETSDPDPCSPPRFMRHGGDFCTMCDAYIASWEPTTSDAAGCVSCDRCFA